MVLVVGAVLAPGRRTVAAALRAVGLAQRRSDHKCHNGLSRAMWSARQRSRVLLAKLVEAFGREGPLVFGIDDTIERRWSVEVAFEEVRARLGMETQRQRSDLAILHTTPYLLGLFSLVALMADRVHRRGELSVRRAAWDEKERATFADALATVRKKLWQRRSFRCLIRQPRP